MNVINVIFLNVITEHNRFYDRKKLLLRGEHYAFETFAQPTILYILLDYMRSYLPAKDC